MWQITAHKDSAWGPNIMSFAINSINRLIIKHQQVTLLFLTLGEGGREGKNQDSTSEGDNRGRQLKCLSPHKASWHGDCMLEHTNGIDSLHLCKQPGCYKDAKEVARHCVAWILQLVMAEQANIKGASSLTVMAGRMVAMEKGEYPVLHCSVASGRSDRCHHSW